MSAEKADAAFRAHIGAQIEARHAAWLARLPGDGLATDIVRDANDRPVLDENDREIPTRVTPTLHAHTGGPMVWERSRCDGHTCPA